MSPTEVVVDHATRRVDEVAGMDLSLAKQRLPLPVKQAAEAALRVGGRLSAGLRDGPDFLIVGTKRGGTTSLWNALLDHPQVMPMVPAAKNLKSPAYFYAHYGRGRSWYLGHFPTRSAKRAHADRHGAAVTGEASPMYLWDPRVPARAAATVPQARILVLLRDPVARAVSHHRERCKQGVESLELAAALGAEPGRLAGEERRMAHDPSYYSRPWDWYSYRRRGEYAASLAAWFRHYPREQVLVLPSELFFTDQPAAMRAVHAHLGLAPHDAAPVHLNTVSPALVPTAPVGDDLAAELRAHYAPHNRALAEQLGTAPWWDTAAPTPPAAPSTPSTPSAP